MRNNVTAAAARPTTQFIDKSGSQVTSSKVTDVGVASRVTDMGMTEEPRPVEIISERKVAGKS